jgi:hypothetical protein
MSSVLFRHPVQSVTQVLVDGIVIPASGYALYDGNRLVRVDGTWPACQDWQIPVSGAGAWSVTVVYGFPDAVNPGRIRQRVAIWNPDDFDTPRRPGAGHW